MNEPIPASEPELLNMDLVRVDPTWALRIPANLALRRKVLPFAFIDGMVYVACLDSEDTQTLQAVERYVDRPILAEAAEAESLERALQRIFGGPLANSQTTGAPIRGARLDPKLQSEPDPATLVALCDELLHAAAIREASDLHIDPGPEDISVRLRVDGVLEEYRRLPKIVQGSLTSRIKVLSGLDIAERRSPQDGRFGLPIGNNVEIDVRVASLPTKHGEKLTLRLLSSKVGELTLESLGMSGEDRQRFEAAIERPYGLILLTGPTGSGKSTTLYAALRRLITLRSLNVLTIEDPVEYEINRVAQVEVDAGDKVSFHKAMRSILRHDPDVLMIGEIRDGETADVAIKAALTGHLVLSTLHTNSAPSAVTRLIDMGLEPYLVGATLRLSVAQRLVRRICPNCLNESTVSTAQARALGRPDIAGQTVFTPTGCKFCASVGFVGRLGLFEMLPVDEDLSRAITEGASENEVIDQIHQQGIPRLVDDALAKLLDGKTTVDETLAAVTVW